MSATLTLGESEAAACEGASTSSGDGLSDANTASLVASKSSTAKKAKDKHERQQNIRQLFAATGRMSWYDETMEPSWGEDPISLDNVVDICEQILWELHETNWCCELRALNAHLLDMSKWGSLHQWEREAQVAKVWDRRATRS
ncbi:hypothetical protein SCP_1601360 [Sparassis crispa]|uniref:Uncharacterized protein n=1 Tax=Sparassis crispa TaxID=139825 RepID=A0A401H4X7_9APHY|nr:hypothetical protein SCP_1601360 [Sparassis crispa]GBE89474.1 hypothetical protein SCP_1601360 [Sparassis crispa]